jgi:hypothetical protein
MEIHYVRPSVTELRSVTSGRPGPAQKKWDSEQKRDSDFDELGPARHDIVTKVDVQVDRAQPGPAKRDSEQKRDSDFDEPSLARHGTVTEVDFQADRARPGKNRIRMNLLI